MVEKTKSDVNNDSYDSEELQLLDVSNRKWVEDWIKAVYNKK